MGLFSELASRFLAPAEELFLDPEKRIEGKAGDELEDFYVLHVRPAETAPLPWEPPVDALSLHLQKLARGYLGIEPPDIRFRIITEMNSDGIKGGHFGTPAGALRKAEKIRDLDLGIIDGTATNATLRRLPVPK